MARLALIPVALFPLWAACASTADSRFAEPNALMGEEIRSRVAQIQYQHREELFHSLLWLAQSGEQAIPALLEGLRHNDAKVRSNCAWVLAQIGDRRVIEDLQPLVHDVNETVRLEVARTLVLLGDVQQCPPLIDALDSEKVQVRYLCHEALKTSTGQDFGYDHLSDDLTERHRTALLWREWWSDVSGDPWFAQTYATEHGLAEPAAEPQPEVPPTPFLEQANPGTDPQNGNDSWGSTEQGTTTTTGETTPWTSTEQEWNAAAQPQTTTETNPWATENTQNTESTESTETTGATNPWMTETTENTGTSGTTTEPNTPAAPPMPFPTEGTTPNGN